MIKNTLTFLTGLLSGFSDDVARHALLSMQKSIDYLQEENKILRQQLREKYNCKRVRLTDIQKRRLAAKAFEVGKKGLMNLTTIFQPATLLAWHRKLIAQKYDGSKRRNYGGRPGISKKVEQQILEIAKKNPSWGYKRILGVMGFLGFKVELTTIRRILKNHGIVPDPERSRSVTWKEFLSSHKEVMSATDFFSIEVLTPRGLIRCMVLFVIDIASRKVEIAGIKTNPDGNWMKQMARNLTDCETGFLKDKKYLIHDRDPLFTKDFKSILAGTDVQCVRTSAFAPNMNAHAERFVQTIKHECLGKIIFASQAQLEYAVEEFVEYYNHERPHESLGGNMIEPRPQDPDDEVVEFSRLGGLLRSYRRVKRAA